MLKRKSEQFLLPLACILTGMLGISVTHAELELDDFDLETVSLESPTDSSDFLEAQALDQRMTKACTSLVLAPEVYVGILTSPPINLQNFLAQQTLYNRTNPPVVRELHDIPTLMPFQYHCAPSWAFSANGFYNQTRKVVFGNNSSCLNSYINLNLPHDVLNIVPSADSFAGAEDIPDILSVLGNITLEERRLGAMLDVWKHHERFLFTAALPVYFVEHNFALSQKKQDQIQESPLFKGGAGFPGINLETFNNQHLERDQAGIGDLRLQLLYNVASSQHIAQGQKCRGQQIQLGGQITFPTAVTLVNGILGGRSCLRKPPLVDFETLGNLAFCADPVRGDNDKESRLNLYENLLFIGTAALDQLAQTVCDASLGQLHFNLGPVAHVQQPLGERASFEWYGEMKYSIPCNETRFLQVVTSAADFNRDYSDAAAGPANLLFLDQQTTNYLFPAIVKIKIKPGLIFHTNAAFNAFWNDWELGLGYDFWAQMREHFGSIDAQCSGYGNVFKTSTARKQTAYEGKLFGQLFTRFCGDNFFMRFGLRGDVTLHRHNIGRSFTVGINFIIDF